MEHDSKESVEDKNTLKNKHNLKIREKEPAQSNAEMTRLKHSVARSNCAASTVYTALRYPQI